MDITLKATDGDTLISEIQINNKILKYIQVFWKMFCGVSTDVELTENKLKRMRYMESMCVTMAINGYDSIYPTYSFVSSINDYVKKTKCIVNIEKISHELFTL